MGLNTYPTPFECRVIESNETYELFNFTSPNSFELKHLIVDFYKHGSLVGYETMQLRIHSSLDFSKIYAQSDEINLSDFAFDPYHIFRQRFDFGKINITANIRYYISLKTQNYTRDGDDFYLGTIFDAPFTINTGGSNSTAVSYHQFTPKTSVIGYR